MVNFLVKQRSYSSKCVEVQVFCKGICVRNSKEPNGRYLNLGAITLYHFGFGTMRHFLLRNCSIGALGWWWQGYLKFSALLEWIIYQPFKTVAYGISDFLFSCTDPWCFAAHHLSLITWADRDSFKNCIIWHLSLVFHRHSSIVGCGSMGCTPAEIGHPVFAIASVHF